MYLCSLELAYQFMEKTTTRTKTGATTRTKTGATTRTTRTTKTRGKGKTSTTSPPTNLREWVKNLLLKDADHFAKCLAQLDPKEYIDVYLRLLNYAVPKLKPLEPIEYEAQIKGELDDILDDELDDYDNWNPDK